MTRRSKKMDVVAGELERIRAKHGARHCGMLKARDVVAEARRKSSPLHSHFEWNDTKAAREHRLWQARQLINVVVDYVTEHDIGPVNVYVSLRKDRRRPGGGYRHIVDVMSDRRMRAALLKEALDDFKHWEDRYRVLKAVAPIIAAANRVRRKNKPKKGRGRAA